MGVLVFELGLLGRRREGLILGLGVGVETHEVLEGGVDRLDRVQTQDVGSATVGRGPVHLRTEIL